MAGMLLVLLIIALLGVPVVFALGFSGLVYFLVENRPELLPVVPQRMLSGINSFSLLAIPLFLFAAECMSKSGITERLIRFVQTMVGHVCGGLAYTNVLISLFFGGISGTALSDVSTLGPIFVPSMEKVGYTRGFAAAVTAASSLQGAVIPPSVVAIIYAATVGDVSVGALFLAGIVPGVLICLTDLAVVWWRGRRLKWPKSQRRSTPREILAGAWDALTALVMPVIVVLGIVLGMFTPTEAAAIAAGYAVIIGVLVYRTLTSRDLLVILRRISVTSAVLLMIASAASIHSWIFGFERVSHTVAEILVGLTDNRLALLLLVIVVLLFIGMWLDTLAAIIIFGPVLSSAMVSLGFDPVHFGMVMLLALVIGFITPPFGICLFAASAVSKCSISRITREIWPYIAVGIAVLLSVVTIPELALWLPRWVGLI